MTRTEIIILVVLSVVLVVGLVGAGIFKKKKKKNKPAVEQKKSEKPEKEEKRDTSFKIVKNGKSAKISKKALKNNARSGLVERVYEKTYEPDKNDDGNMFIEIPLGKQSEQIYEAYKNFEDDGSGKIVSLGELKRKNSSAVKQVEEHDNLADRKEFVKSKFEEMKAKFAGAEDLQEPSMFGLPRYRSQFATEEKKTVQQSQDDSDMVEAEAILHRKGIRLKR